MAARQPEYKNLNVLSKGAPRTRVIAELGRPLLTEERDGKRVDIFAFKQGYGRGNKAARMFFHAAADVWTLGLWEVIGTPAEAIAHGRNIKLEVTYDENDLVEDIKYIDKDYSNKKEDAPQKKVEGVIVKEEQPKTELPVEPKPVESKTTTKIQLEINSSIDSTAPATYADYYRHVYRSVSKAVVKPEGSTGTINASFTLSADGSLQNVEILESSSQDPALKSAVEDAIKSSAPFPAFPDDIKAEGTKKFTITLEFRNR